MIARYNTLAGLCGLILVTACGDHAPPHLFGRDGGDFTSSDLAPSSKDTTTGDTNDDTDSDTSTGEKTDSAPLEDAGPASDRDSNSDPNTDSDTATATFTPADTHSGASNATDAETSAIRDAGLDSGVDTSALPDAGLDSETSGTDAGLNGGDTETATLSDLDAGHSRDTDRTVHTDAGLDGGLDASVRADTESDTASIPPPKNIVLFIGDGMGLEQVKAAGMYAHGAAESMVFERFPVKGAMTTWCLDADVTDSGAAATAMATGHKTTRGVISRAIPGDGADLETLLEFFKDNGKATGMVTNTSITHATPAGFGAHADARSQIDIIAGDYYTHNPLITVLFGSGDGTGGVTVTDAEAAGYTVITALADAPGLTAADAPVLGLFGESQLPYEQAAGFPENLTMLAERTIEILSEDEDGFFAMIEGGLIDWGCHANNLESSVHETVELENAVTAILGMVDLEETLVIVTADHETGGLTVTETSPEPGRYPTVTWSTSGHTAANVGVYVDGAGSEAFRIALESGDGVIDNTDIHRLIHGMY